MFLSPSSKLAVLAYDATLIAGEHDPDHRGVLRNTALERSCTPVRVCHHTLVGGTDGGVQRCSAGARCLGKTLPDLLVSALCLCATAGICTSRCRRPDPGILRVAAGAGLVGRGRSATRSLPLISIDQLQPLSGERMGQGQNTKTRWWPDCFSTIRCCGYTLRPGTSG